MGRRRALHALHAHRARPVLRRARASTSMAAWLHGAFGRGRPDDIKAPDVEAPAREPTGTFSRFVPLARSRHLFPSAEGLASFSRSRGQFSRVGCRSLRGVSTPTTHTHNPGRAAGRGPSARPAAPTRTCSTMWHDIDKRADDDRRHPALPSALPHTRPACALAARILKGGPRRPDCIDSRGAWARPGPASPAARRVGRRLGRVR